MSSDQHVFGGAQSLASTDNGREFYAGLLQTLSSVMGSAKGYLREHGPRTAVLANRIGAELGLDPRLRAQIVFSAILSDMGMVGLAEDAWENPVQELGPRARERVQRHPLRSEERLLGIPHLESLGPLVRHHHEWWNGGGYPDGLRGLEIPIGARILRLADTVTALAAPRPQRGPLTPTEINHVVVEGSGSEFGPDVVRAWLSVTAADELPVFFDAAYRETLMWAAELLVPEEISPLSTNQLLTIVANLIDAKDPYTGGHSRRVALLAVAVADQLRLAGHLKSALWSMGYLHDLGKLAVPLRVLSKEGGLTDEEFAFIKEHPVAGAEILEEIPTLTHLSEGVRSHHERWDGSGYPDGLRGEEIPLVAQVLAVCDAYDAMTSRRAYRDSLGTEYALEEIQRERGTHFSPAAAEGFLSIPPDIFAGLHTPLPEAFLEIPNRVQTLRHIDPRWFTSQGTPPAAEPTGT